MVAYKLLSTGAIIIIPSPIAHLLLLSSEVMATAMATQSEKLEKKKMAALFGGQLRAKVCSTR